MQISGLILSLVGFILGMLVMYLTAYSKAKGKNKALLEDISKLEDEKQKIVAKYRSETEELKKRHALDIEKRKYKYEEKRAQFSRYFEFLDEFHGKCNSIFTERFPPIMNKFLGSYLSDDQSEKQQAILNFNREVQSVFNELYQEQLKVKTETNSIRLISSPELDNLLDELESTVEKATDQASQMLKFMGTPEFWADQTLIKPYQEEAAMTGLEVQKLRDALRNRMKVELDEI